MLILSEYKDIYDHLAYIYGVDNNIVYERPSFITIEDKDAKFIKNFIDLKHTDIFSRFCLQDRMMERYLDKIFGYIILFGRFIPVVGTLKNEEDKKLIHITSKFFERYSFKFCTKPLFAQYVTEVITYNFKLHNGKVNKRLDRIYFPSEERLYNWYDAICDKVFPELLAINDKYNQPILSSFVGANNTCYIPILSSISGFNKRFPDDKLYQDIYNFLIKNKKNVDLEPPVEIDNISKIEKAGFDKKKSFRHPIK